MKPSPDELERRASLGLGQEAQVADPLLSTNLHTVEHENVTWGETRDEPHDPSQVIVTRIEFRHGSEGEFAPADTLDTRDHRGDTTLGIRLLRLRKEHPPGNFHFDSFPEPKHMCTLCHRTSPFSEKPSPIMDSGK
jgi:hypothetical protein